MDTEFFVTHVLGDTPKHIIKKGGDTPFLIDERGRVLNDLPHGYRQRSEMCVEETIGFLEAAKVGWCVVCPYTNGQDVWKKTLEGWTWVDS